MNAQLVLENITVRLPNRVLFEDVNWTIYEGMRVALAGRNGSGKSTLADKLVDLFNQAQYNVELLDGDVVRRPFTRM